MSCVAGKSLVLSCNMLKRMGFKSLLWHHCQNHRELSGSWWKGRWQAKQSSRCITDLAILEKRKGSRKKISPFRKYLLQLLCYFPVAHSRERGDYIKNTKPPAFKAFTWKYGRIRKSKGAQTLDLESCSDTEFLITADAALCLLDA